MGLPQFSSKLNGTQLGKFLVGFFLLFGGFASAQNSVQSVSARDPQAVAAIKAALTAMGGQAAIAAIQDATVNGQSQSTDPSVPPNQFVWKNTGMSMRHEYTMSDGLHVSVVTQGKGQRQEPSGQKTTIDRRASLTILPYHMPGTILLMLLNSPDVSLSFISDPVDDGNLFHIRAMRQLSQPMLSPVTRQDWFFDPATGLPVKVNFYLPDTRNQRLDGTATVAFTSWQTVSSVQVPQVTQLFYDGVLQETVTLGIPAFNQGLSASTFQLQ